MINGALFLTVAIAAQLPTSFGPPKSTPQQVHPTLQQAPSKNLPQQIQPTPQQVPSKNLPQQVQPTPQYGYAPSAFHGSYMQESYSQVRYAAQAAPCGSCGSAQVAYGTSQAACQTQAPIRGKFKQKMKFKGRRLGGGRFCG